MKRLLMTLAIPALVTTSTAHAESAYDIAGQMATMIAAQDLCDIRVDAETMLVTLAEKIDAGDLTFNAKLDAQMTMAEYRAGEMAGIQKTLHCAQAKRNAEHYGWIAGQ